MKKKNYRVEKNPQKNKKHNQVKVNDDVVKKKNKVSLCFFIFRIDPSPNLYGLFDNNIGMKKNSKTLLFLIFFESKNLEKLLEKLR